MLFSGSDVDLRASEVVFGRLFHFFGSLLENLACADFVYQLVEGCLGEYSRERIHLIRGVSR